MITVILNGYRRPDNLNRQLEAIKSQTYPAQEVLLWYNFPGEDIDINYEIGEKIPTAYSNHNYGVWARFYFALNARCPYICVFDDDTIPGKRWLENCMNTMKEYHALLGTVGLIYTEPTHPEKSSYYDSYNRVGWPPGCNNDIATRVDFVGHSWFFKRGWLSYMLRELPDPKYNNCGEDMHFSYMLQKYANIPTYVPPHPISDKELWGSVDGWLGADSNSLWESDPMTNSGTSFKSAMNTYFNTQRRNGWKLINEL